LIFAFAGRATNVLKISERYYHFVADVDDDSGRLRGIEESNPLNIQASTPSRSPLPDLHEISGRETLRVLSGVNVIDPRNTFIE